MCSQSKPISPLLVLGGWISNFCLFLKIQTGREGVLRECVSERKNCDGMLLSKLPHHHTALCRFVHITVEYVAHGDECDCGCRKRSYSHTSRRTAELLRLSLPLYNKMFPLFPTKKHLTESIRLDSDWETVPLLLPHCSMWGSQVSCFIAAFKWLKASGHSKLDFYWTFSFHGL